MQHLISQIGHTATAELVNMWQKEAPKRLECIEREFHSGNHDKVRQEAHALRGACSVFGLSEATEACRNIEETVKNGKPVELPQLLELTQALQNAAAFLRASVHG